MNRMIALGLLFASGTALQAQPINVRGSVTDGAGKPVPNAVAALAKAGVRDTTGADGAYSLIKPGVSVAGHPASGAETMRLDDGVLSFRLGDPAPLKVQVYDTKGGLRNEGSLPMAQPGDYHFEVRDASLPDQMLIVRASIGPLVRSFRCFPRQNGNSAGEFTLASPGSARGMLAKIAGVVDSLNVSAVGYAPRKIALGTYDTLVNVTLLADATTVYNPCPTNGDACKILPFGDSITEGVKSSDGAGYRSQLFKLIVAAKQKVTFVGSLSNGPTTVSGQSFPRTHEGHAGWTIEPGFSEFSGYGGISSLVPSPALNGAPHIILLHIGANDLFPSGRATMAERLDALVEKIAKNAPTALIVLAKITPVGTSNNGHTQAQVDAANAAQAAYNGKIPGIIQAHVAKGHHVIGVDMSGMPLSDLTTSSLHPNDKGYAYMAEIWYPAIKDLLPK